MLVLLTGGARSGKSSSAVRLAASAGAPVHYLATAEPGDDEMVQRIARHRAERPAAWTTVETPVEVGAALASVPDGDTVVIDCLALWVTNRLDADDAEIVDDARRLAGLAASRSGTTIVVTNEVGSGIVPDNALARRFRDVLGSVNQAVADASDRAYLCVAGGALALTTIPGLA